MLSQAKTIDLGTFIFTLPIHTEGRRSSVSSYATRAPRGAFSSRAFTAPRSTFIRRFRSHRVTVFSTFWPKSDPTRPSPADQKRPEWNLLELGGICWNSVEFVGIWWNGVELLCPKLLILEIETGAEKTRKSLGKSNKKSMISESTSVRPAGHRITGAKTIDFATFPIIRIPVVTTS